MGEKSYWTDVRTCGENRNEKLLFFNLKSESKQMCLKKKKKVKNTNIHARISFLGKSGNIMFRSMSCTTVEKGKLYLSTIWPSQDTVWSHVLKGTAQCKMKLSVPDSHVRNVTENWKSCPYLSPILLSKNYKCRINLIWY